MRRLLPRSILPLLTVLSAVACGQILEVAPPEGGSGTAATEATGDETAGSTMAGGATQGPDTGPQTDGDLSTSASDGGGSDDAGGFEDWVPYCSESGGANTLVVEIEVPRSADGVDIALTIRGQSSPGEQVHITALHDGVEAVMLDTPSCGEDIAFFLRDDAAPVSCAPPGDNPVAPVEPLSGLADKPYAGTWTLTIDGGAEGENSISTACVLLLPSGAG